MAGLISFVLILTNLGRYWQSRNIAENKVIEVEQGKLSLLKHEIEGNLEFHRNNLLTLIDVPPVKAIIRSRTNNDIDPLNGNTLEQWNQRLRVIFISFLKNHPDYYQIRFIDLNSDELINIQSAPVADIGFSAYFSKPTTTSDLFDALSVVAEDGKALQQADPLVMKYYLKSLKRSDSDTSSDLQKKSFNNTRILIVEDNLVNQLVATGILNGHGFKMIDIAANGFEAITSLQESAEDAPYSVVLMDCLMPEKDGYEASRQIRAGKAGERNKIVPIMAMTANAMEGDREKCLQSGMDDYLSKPIDPELLISKLRE